ncbi:hypothetical protein [Paraburkholderia mimosarum]|uniref:hypothetical protein n=1 Tax=Paraburkholderia mimosarum TaxID=312026 RepID=UPI0012DD103B|nr:hypothetical protein [Paraburkholderia mimosarum]
MTTQYNYSQQAARLTRKTPWSPAVATAFAANWRDVTAKGVPYNAPLFRRSSLSFSRRGSVVPIGLACIAVLTELV